MFLSFHNPYSNIRNDNVYCFCKLNSSFYFSFETELFFLFISSGVNSALPPDEKLDLSKKMFQPTDNEIFKTSRERERIDIFLSKCQDVGLSEATLFQIDCLYERTNLPQVMGTVRCLGIEVSFSLPQFSFFWHLIKINLVWFGFMEYQPLEEI